MSTFPTSIPSYLGFTAGHTLLLDVHASQHNLEQADITAIATKVGTGASTPTSGNVLTGSGVGTSSWSPVNLITMVSGVLPVANGGTGISSLGANIAAFLGTPSSANLAAALTDETGTGAAVFANSPTLTTPTVGDFTNSTHSHQNNAGGGQLGFAALLSTIFSGQVQSQANAGTAGGTMYYINLGGIKLLWMVSGNVTGTSSGPTYGVTFPTNFFSSIQSAICTVHNIATTSQQNVNFATGFPTTSAGNFALWSVSNTTNEQVGLLVIGT